MAAEENNGDGNSSTTQRQRFYVELKHGETTIVSWKKLLKEARKKDQCPLASSAPYSSSSTVLEIQDISCDAGQCNGSVNKNKTVKHGATSSDQIQQSKHRVKMTKIEGQKNDDLSIQLARPNEMNGKVTSETANLFKHSSSPAKVKDHPPKEVWASTVDVPLLTYSKRRTAFRSKSKCPPLNTVENACVSPLETTHNVVQKNQNISIEGSNKKAGVGGYSYDAMHQKIEECSSAKIDSMPGTLHAEVSSKIWHNDKSDDAIPPCYKSPLKDSDHKSVNAVKTRHVRAPCKKRKITGSSNDCNSIPYLTKKTASKKAATELPALQSNSSDSPVKIVKLTLKQKPLVPQKTNVKVRFLLKQEHETLKSSEKPAKDALNHSSTAASAM